MIWLGSVLLLGASALLLWLNRPAAHWPGAAAARFAAALITALYALLAPWQVSELASSQLLLQQLSLYAALPLLLSVTAATAFGYDWSRMIWGRVLLGWCVVFELCRRNDVLAECLQLEILAGLLITLLPLILNRRVIYSALLYSTGWLVLMAGVWLQPAWLSPLIILTTALLLIFINPAQRQQTTR